MSGRRLARMTVCAALAVASMGALAACGEDTLSADEVAQIKVEARREALAEARARAAERETQRLRRDVEDLKRRGTNGAVGGGSSSGGSAGGSTSCGDGLSVNSVTSCPFARNVRVTYEGSGGASTIDVYSPVTGQTYRMSCSSGVPVVCTGGDGAAVYIR